MRRPRGINVLTFRALPEYLPVSLPGNPDGFACGITTPRAMDPDENRLRMARRIPAMAGLPAARVAVGEQVHGDRIAIVAGKEPFREHPAVDALITAEPNQMLAVFTADCVPILLADPVHGFAATVHAGREGTLRGIAARVVRELECLGSRASDLVAWIGPAICHEHYAVGRNLADLFRAAFPQWPDLARDDRLDLPEANRRLLLARGLAEERIAVDRRCTFEHPDLFYSHRRDATKGRMAAWIVRSA